MATMMLIRIAIGVSRSFVGVTFIRWCSVPVGDDAEQFGTSRSAPPNPTVQLQWRIRVSQRFSRVLRVG
jgi:hypothetical protein